VTAKWEDLHMPHHPLPVPDPWAASADAARQARRIIVAGNDGSGKTTLCRQLSALLNIQYTELDSLRFGPDWNELPQFMTDVAELADRSEWITEWDFEGARELLATRADFFVWIDLPRWKNIQRTLARSVRARLGRRSLWGTNVEPPLHTILTNRWHSVRVAVQNHDAARHLAETFIREHPSIPAVHLRAPHEIAEFRGRIAG
jgi:adenylate kinase family enzyme